MRVNGLTAALAVVVAAGAWGCGSVDEGDNARQAVERAVKREARDRLGDFAATPAYMETSPGRQVIDQLRERGPVEAKRVTGVIRTRIEASPAKDKRRLLRSAAAGGEVQISNRFTARVRRDGDRWIVPTDGVEIEPAEARMPSGSELRRARRAGLGAVRALLTWNGDRKRYARAQEGRYATLLASERPFRQPGFDPTPSLVLEDPLPDSDTDTDGGGDDEDSDLGAVPDPDAPLDTPTQVPPGAAWPRTDDGGNDDVPLRSVLSQRAGDPDCERFTLGAMKPAQLGGEIVAGGDDPDTAAVEFGELPDGVTETAYLTGSAVVRAGNWESRSRYSTCFGRRVTSQEEPVRIGRRTITVPYTVALSRSMASPNDEWFVTTLRLGSDEAFEAGEGSETVYTVDDSL